jgi:hypothetical protein
VAPSHRLGGIDEIKRGGGGNQLAQHFLSFTFTVAQWTYVRLEENVPEHI